GDVIKLFIPALLRLGRLCRRRRRSLRRRTCHRKRSIRRRTSFLKAFSILFSFVSVSFQRNSILCRGGGLFIPLCTRRVFRFLRDTSAIGLCFRLACFRL